MLQLSPAAPQRHKWLTIHPLLTPEAGQLDFELMPDAVAAGTLKVTEVGSGTVPELLAINEGERDVLVLDGMQFIGARQNRMASRTILLPAGSQTKIPVNCMEQGRWHSVSDTFAPSVNHSPSRVRRKNKELEYMNVMEGVSADARSLSQAQSSVWEEIGLHSRDVGVGSSTGNLDEIARGRAEDLGEWVRAFPPVEGQVGILAFLGPDPLGLDVIGDRKTWSRLHERLVGGYVQDALRVRNLEGEPDPEAAATWMAQVRGANRTESPTVGRGTYRVLSGPVTGGELIAGDGLVHLSAFPLEEERPEGGRPVASDTDPLPPPSWRRRPSGR